MYEIITPKGRLVIGEFPQLFENPDHAEYADRANQLVEYWRSADLSHTAIIPQPIDSILFDSKCSDRSFIFGYVSEMIEVSRVMTSVGVLVQLLCASTADHPSVRFLLENHIAALTPDFTAEKIQGLLPDVVLDMPCSGAIEYLLSMMVQGLDKKCEMLVFYSMKDLDLSTKENVQNAMHIFDCFCHLVFVRWFLYLSNPESPQARKNLQDVLALLSAEKSIGVFLEMGRLTAKSYGWFLAGGKAILQDIDLQDQSQVQQVEAFIDDLCRQDSLQIHQVLVAFRELSVEAQKEVRDSARLLTLTRTMLSCFQHSARVTIEDCAAFWLWLKLDEEKWKRWPHLHRFVKEEKSYDLESVTKDILLWRTVDDLGKNRQGCMAVLQAVKANLSRSNAPSFFFYYSMICDTIEMYNHLVGMANVPYKLQGRDFLTAEEFSKREFVLFLINSFYSVVIHARQRVKSRMEVCILHPFPKVVKMEVVPDFLEALARAKGLLSASESFILSAIKMITFYSNAERLPLLSFGQLTALVEQFVLVKNRFQGVDSRERNYFEMLFYPDICNGVSREGFFSDENDFFLKVVCQIKNKVKELRDPNVATDLMLLSIKACQSLVSIRYLSEFFEIFNLMLSKNIIENKAIKNALTKVLRFKLGAAQFSDGLFAEVDALMAELRVFYDTCLGGASIRPFSEAIILSRPPLSEGSYAIYHWKNYYELLLSEKITDQRKKSIVFLSQPEIEREGFLLLTVALLNAIQQGLLSHIESILPEWFYLVACRFKMVSFDESQSHYFWETKIKSLLIQEGIDNALSRLVCSVILVLQSFYDNGRSLKKEDKRVLLSLLDKKDLAKIFEELNSKAYTEAIARQIEPTEPPPLEPRRPKEVLVNANLDRKPPILSVRHLSTPAEAKPIDPSKEDPKKQAEKERVEKEQAARKAQSERDRAKQEAEKVSVAAKIAAKRAQEERAKVRAAKKALVQKSEAVEPTLLAATSTEASTATPELVTPKAFEGSSLAGESWQVVEFVPSAIVPSKEDQERIAMRAELAVLKAELAHKDWLLQQQAQQPQIVLMVPLPPPMMYTPFQFLLQPPPLPPLEQRLQPAPDGGYIDPRDPDMRYFNLKPQ